MSEAHFNGVARRIDPLPYFLRGLWVGLVIGIILTGAASVIISAALSR